MPTVEVSFLHKIIDKFISLYVLLRHGKLPLEYKYHVRDNYYCQLYQLKYFFRDYIFKKKYKITDYKGEFGAELMYALPFAYWHYKNGTLKETISPSFMKEFYFFSPHHEEKYNERIWQGSYNWEIPGILYHLNYNFPKWEPVPLKEHFKNTTYLFSKPLLVIANRYNMEWYGPPISYFDIPTLDFILKNVANKYQVVYNRPGQGKITMDNSEIYELNEIAWLKANHPDVLLMDELYERDKNEVSSFNHFQCKVYANANHFLSIHGGTATLASYFGGTNLILSKRGYEHYFGCFEKLFPKLSGAKILHAKTDEEFKKLLIENF